MVVADAAAVPIIEGAASPALSNDSGGNSDGSSSR